MTGEQHDQIVAILRRDGFIDRQTFEQVAGDVEGDDWDADIQARAEQVQRPDARIERGL